MDQKDYYKTQQSVYERLATYSTGTSGTNRTGNNQEHVREERRAAKRAEAERLTNTYLDLLAD